MRLGNTTTFALASGPALAAHELPILTRASVRTITLSNKRSSVTDNDIKSRIFFVKIISASHGRRQLVPAIAACPRETDYVARADLPISQDLIAFLAHASHAAFSPRRDHTPIPQLASIVAPGMTGHVYMRPKTEPAMVAQHGD